jgi:hypothetical protein
MTKRCRTASCTSFILMLLGAILASRLLTTESNSSSLGVVSSRAFIGLSHPAPPVSRPSLTGLAIQDCYNLCLFPLWHGRAYPWISLKKMNRDPEGRL